MTNFKYNGYNFRISEWNADDDSDRGKGIVEVDTVNVWLEVIECDAFEDESRLTLLDEYAHTKNYSESDYFVFNENYVIDFIKEYEYSVMDYIREEQGV